MCLYPESQYLAVGKETEQCLLNYMPATARRGQVYHQPLFLKCNCLSYVLCYKQALDLFLHNTRRQQRLQGSKSHNVLAQHLQNHQQQYCSSYQGKFTPNNPPGPWLLYSCRESPPGTEEPLKRRKIVSLPLVLICYSPCGHQQLTLILSSPWASSI